MKFTGVKSSPNIVSGNMVASDMTISVDKLNIAAFYLRDAIYTDKPLAVVREYICNALDEHEKHNITRPVEVWFSVEDDINYFNVRDFANGLDEHSVRYVFGALLESTKNQDNNNMGGFGIGSKAGHAYADFFEVVSYYNGTASYYNCVLEKDDTYPVPIGKIRLIMSEDTTESGILIRVPIQKKDLYTFTNKVSSFVRKCKYKKDFNCVIYKEDFDEIISPESQTTFDYDGFSVSVNDFQMATVVGEFNRDVKIRMGHATYTCPAKILNRIKQEVPIVLPFIIIDVPVGTLSVPLSRESIEETDSNLRCLDKIVDSLIEESEKVRANISISYDDLVKSAKESNTNSSCKEDIFYWSFLDLIHFTRPVLLPETNKEADKIKNKYLVWIPANKYTERWKDNLLDFSRVDLESRYLYFTKKYPELDTEFDDMLVKISSQVAGEYTFILAKDVRKELKQRNVISSGFGAKEKGNGVERKYKVEFGKRRSVFMSASDFIKELDPKGELKKLDDISSITELGNQLIIRSTSTYYDTLSDRTIPAIGSYTLFDELVKFGFLDRKNTDVVKKLYTLKETQNKIERVYSEVDQYMRGYNRYNPSPALTRIMESVKESKSTRTLEQNERLYNRLAKLRGKIINHKFSTVSPTAIKIIKSICPVYYAESRLSRDEFRTILKLGK